MPRLPRPDTPISTASPLAPSKVDREQYFILKRVFRYGRDAANMYLRVILSEGGANYAAPKSKDDLYHP
jgi:hypothetical protein